MIEIATSNSICVKLSFTGFVVMRRDLSVSLVLLVDKKINGRYYLVNGAMYLVTPNLGELIQSD